MSGFVLYGTPGWGSALVEAQLDFYQLNYRFETVGDLFMDASARAKLEGVNPLTQVPTLVLPGGEVMTESAAITLWLAAYTGRDDLVPGPGAPGQAALLRWLVFLVTNIYPTFTYADDPSRFVSVEAAQAPFRAAVNDYGKRALGNCRGRSRCALVPGDTVLGHQPLDRRDAPLAAQP